MRFVIEAMWKRPSISREMEAHARAALEKLARVDSTSNEKVFDDGVTTFGATEEQWVIGWILSKTELTVAALLKAKVYDSEAIKHTFCHMLNCTMNARWPAECIRVAVAAKLLDLRWAECGCRLQGVTDDQFLVAGGSGKVNWQCVGAFRLVFDADKTKALTITHVPTRITKNLEVEVITPDSDLLHVWQDAKAEARRGGSVVRFADVFAKNEGPNQIKVLTGSCKHLTELCVVALERINAEHELAGRCEALQIKEEVGKAEKAHKEEMSKRAREVLKAKNELRCSRRKLKASD